MHMQTIRAIELNNNVIMDVFLKQVFAQPDAQAAGDEQGSCTYGQLAALSLRMSQQLPRDVSFAGIVCDHGVAQIAAILAILTTGAAYVPAEPDFPPERIRFMMNESAVSYVITTRDYAERLSGFKLVFLEDLLEGAQPDAGEDEGASSPEAIDQLLQACKPAQHPEAPAYVLYTSGTTGTPKGVVVTNHNVCHYARAFEHEFHVGLGDVTLQYSVCSFDIFVEEVFATLLNGGALCIPSAKLKENLVDTMAFAEAHNTTIISGFPYLVADMGEQGCIPHTLRLLISGGDVLRARYTEKLPAHLEIYNTYGPSETTVCCSYYRATDQEPLEDGTYPVGKAVLESTVTIRDENLQPVSAGTIGEICIQGEGVSLGYKDPSKNAAFIDDAPGGRLYRSGDMGYELPDGNIVFLHRKDTQVMILGKRVETEEVENVLANCTGVESACVRAYLDDTGLAYMVAYVVAAPEFTLRQTRAEMAQHLTPFMIPEFFVSLDEMPLNTNGKVDDARLPVVLKEGQY